MHSQWCHIKVRPIRNTIMATVRPNFPHAHAFHVSAPTMGSGKTYLYELIGVFCRPRLKNKVSYSTSSEEAAKAILSLRLTSIKFWSGLANTDSVLRCVQPERMDTRNTKRRNFSDNFKAAVALEALRGDKTVQEISAKRQLHPTQVVIPFKISGVQK